MDVILPHFDTIWLTSNLSFNSLFLCLWISTIIHTRNTSSSDIHSFEILVSRKWRRNKYQDESLLIWHDRGSNTRSTTFEANTLNIRHRCSYNVIKKITWMFAYSGVQRILCCVFFFFFLCAIFWQFLWIVLLKCFFRYSLKLFNTCM